jgi:hypothetical protein
MQKVLEQISDTQSSVFVINWSWLDRFDYVHPVDETFLTLRPDGDSLLHKVYFRDFYSQYHTMLTNTSWIACVIAMLQEKNIKFVMTCMDQILTETVQPTWHDPRSVTLLQDYIGPHISWFEDQTFLEWSRSHGYEESEAWHPLEAAHQAAADYMISVFDKQKIVDPVQQVHV